jgi:hypothetical protein
VEFARLGSLNERFGLALVTHPSAALAERVESCRGLLLIGRTIPSGAYFNTFALASKYSPSKKLSPRTPGLERRNYYFDSSNLIAGGLFLEDASRFQGSLDHPRWARAAVLTFQMIYQQPVRYEYSRNRPTLLVVVPRTTSSRLVSTRTRPSSRGSGIS